VPSKGIDDVKLCYLRVFVDGRVRGVDDSPWNRKL